MPRGKHRQVVVVEVVDRLRVVGLELVVRNLLDPRASHLAEQLAASFAADRLGDDTYRFLGLDEAEGHSDALSLGTLAPGWDRLNPRYVRYQTEKPSSGQAERPRFAATPAPPARSGLFRRLRAAFQSRDQLVQLQLPQPLPHSVELARRVLDQRAALRAEVERLPPPPLAPPPRGRAPPPRTRSARGPPCRGRASRAAPPRWSRAGRLSARAGRR